MQIAVLGSGFAGALTARVARAQGHDVTLIDRGTHPRFALGESSTPLAAIALERLARRYGLADLADLAAWGRWTARLPQLRRGLKRGFTFYRHARGQPFRNDAANANRLLVAASPDDAAADAHWVRADVDHHLVRRAEAEGVRHLDRTDIDDVARRGGRLRLAGVRAGRRIRLTADLVVDGTGAGGVLARQLGLGSAVPPRALHTALIYGHVTGLRPFRETAAAGTRFPDGPYPDQRAAVHHLLDDGWLYELAFDHGVTSTGFVVTGQRAARAALRQAPADAFRALTGRYPSLAARYAEAAPVRPLASAPRLQRRLDRAAGPDWALLPHAYLFWSPLFSTGIAWSVLGVERLGLILEHAGGAPTAGARRGRLTAGLQRYAALVRTEGDHLRRLIEAAYRCRRDFEAFDALAQAYFIAASWSETVQRLDPAPAAAAGGAWAWTGFLGAADPGLRRIVTRTIALLRAPRPADPLRAVGRLAAPRNVAGLADPARRRLYPADPETLVAAAGRLGLTPDEVRARLPRLRGGAAA